MSMPRARIRVRCRRGKPTRRKPSSQSLEVSKRRKASVLMDQNRGFVFVLTRFLDANRNPLRLKTLWHAAFLFVIRSNAVPYGIIFQEACKRRQRARPFPQCP